VGKHRVKLLLFLLLVSATVSVLRPAKPQPTYQGKPIAHWMFTFWNPYGYGVHAKEDARQALKAIGTNALPFFVQWISETPGRSRFRDVLQTYSYRLPLLSQWDTFQRWLSTVPENEAAMNYSLAAVDAFAVLGVEASAAIPDLAKIAHASYETRSAQHAIRALANIGPPALPSVTAVASDSSAACRCYAITALEDFGTNAIPAIPLLLNCLTNPLLTVSAAETIQHLKLEPRSCVPALLQLVNTPDENNQICAIRALGAFGKEAVTAAPAINSLLGSSSFFVRGTARKALLQIAPELLTNTPAQ
jgi:hypothetical protein